MPEPKMVFIVGAARSGTKYLRDLLGSGSSVAVVPHDVNFLWRYGNESCAHDSLRPEMVSHDAREYIRRRLVEIAFSQNGPAPIVVEKSVSSCLRVPMIRSVFPGATFVFLERNGLDTIASSYSQWLNPDSGHLRDKLSLLSRRDWRYLRWYVGNRVGTKGNPLWGPRYEGMSDDLLAHGVAYASARQWIVCVEEARRAFEPEDSVLLRYESLADSDDGIGQVLAELELVDAGSVATLAEQSFEARSTWPGGLSIDDQECVRSLLLAAGLT